MKFEKHNLMRTGGWIRIVGQNENFARVYTNKPYTRDVSEELETAYDVLVRAPEVLDELTATRRALALMKERLLKIRLLDAENSLSDRVLFDKTLTEALSTLIFCEAIGK